MLYKLEQMFNWCLPRICVCCGFASGEHHLDLCGYCKSLLPWMMDDCYRCGALMHQANVGMICAPCTDSAPTFDRVCALFRYRPPLKKLIANLKFRQQLYPARLFANLLAEAIGQRWYEHRALPEVIIPVPLHVQKLRARGFNQTSEIAHLLGAQLGMPVDARVCKRIKHTLPQTGLNKEQRILNMQNAFYVPACSYTYVAILDDVVSTGSTIAVMSQSLHKAGIKNIDVWCVCRA